MPVFRGIELLVGEV